MRFWPWTSMKHIDRWIMLPIGYTDSSGGRFLLTKEQHAWCEERGFRYEVRRLYAGSNSEIIRTLRQRRHPSTMRSIGVSALRFLDDRHAVEFKLRWL